MILRVRAVLLAVATAAALVSCSGQPKTIQGTMIVNGQPIKVTRVWRDPGQPYAYDAWATKLAANIQSAPVTGNAQAEFGKQKLREVGERVELLTQMRSQLAMDWNALAITDEDYSRRSTLIDKSFLALQLAAGQNANPTINQNVLEKLDQWSNKVAADLAQEAGTAKPAAKP